jgi:hypothetical protein
MAQPNIPARARAPQSNVDTRWRVRVGPKLVRDTAQESDAKRLYRRLCLCGFPACLEFVRLGGAR